MKVGGAKPLGENRPTNRPALLSHSSWAPSYAEL
jgi:hypothetical protein